MNWKTFYTRSGTALVFVVVMLAGLLGPSWLFFLLFLLVQTLGIKEYFMLLSKIHPETDYGVCVPLVVQLMGALLLFSFSGIWPSEKALFPVLLFIPTLMFWMSSLTASSGVRKPIDALSALLYVALPLSLLMLMRQQSIILPLVLMALIWINDTMAFIVGSFIGKTPFSAISPKKTWEGTIGGALLCIVVAAIWGYYSPYYTLIDWMMLSLFASVAGTLGDLFESKLKRLANVKDSGSFMPGHGGALDRFDSLLMATPFAFVYSYLFMPALAIHIF